MSVTLVYHKDWLTSLNQLLAGSATVLDIGCGPGGILRQLNCPVKIGIDVHRPYLQSALQGGGIIPIHLEATRLAEIFVPKSIDCVTMIDVIEHLEKDNGLSVLQQAQSVARNRVIVFTPNGYFKQEEVDFFHLGGETYQRHRSGWEVDDFTRQGFNVIVFDKFHDARNPAFVNSYGPDSPPIDALLAWKDCGRK